MFAPIAKPTLDSAMSTTGLTAVHILTVLFSSNCQKPNDRLVLETLEALISFPEGVASPTLAQILQSRNFLPISMLSYLQRVVIIVKFTKNLRLTRATVLVASAAMMESLFKVKVDEFTK